MDELSPYHSGIAGRSKYYRKETTLANMFLTGASGFIGSHLVKKLIADGNHVTAALRSTSSTERVPEYCSTVLVDFLNPSDLAPHLRGADVIYHLAGATKEGSQEEFDLANAAVTDALVKAALSVCPEAHFILASSQSAAGPGNRGPVSQYGVSKLNAEEALTAMPRWTVVRPPVVIGPWDYATEPVFRKAARGLFFSPRTRGGFALVYVEDLVRLFSMLADLTGEKRSILQPSYPELFTWRDFHTLLEGASGRRILHVRIPSLLLRASGRLSELMAAVTGKKPMITRHKIREILSSDWVLEDGLTERLTGWQPDVPVAEAFSKTMNWVKATACNRTS